MILAVQADSDLGKKLAAIVGSSGALNIKALSAESLAETLLPELLPRQWRGQEAVVWDPQAAAAGHFNAEMLRKLWELLATLPDLSALESWPLVPAHDKTLCHLGSLSKVTLTPVLLPIRNFGSAEFFAFDVHCHQRDCKAGLFLYHGNYT